MITQQEADRAKRYYKEGSEKRRIVEMAVTKLNCEIADFFNITSAAVGCVIQTAVKRTDPRHYEYDDLSFWLKPDEITDETYRIYTRAYNALRRAGFRTPENIKEKIDELYYIKNAGNKTRKLIFDSIWRDIGTKRIGRHHGRKEWLPYESDYCANCGMGIYQSATTCPQCGEDISLVVSS